MSKIDARISRLELGHCGESKSVGGKVTEMVINFGPGYRLYFTRREGRIILLLCGGDKSSQGRDIAKAQEMAKEI